MKFLGRTFGAGAMAFLIYIAYLVLEFILVFGIFFIAYFATGGYPKWFSSPAMAGVWPVLYLVSPLIPAFFAGASIRKMERRSHPIAVMLGTGAVALSLLGAFMLAGAPVGIEHLFGYQLAASLLGLAGYGLMAMFTRRKKKVEEDPD